MEKEQFERRKKVINDLMHDKTYVPMKIKELAMVLGVSREKRGELEAVLDELVSEGKIEVSKRGKYQIAKSHLLTGKYTAHVKGFGFVEIEGQEEDIFIPEESSGGAFEGDTVQVAVTPGRTGRRREGKIVRVLERGIAELIGTYQQSKNYGFVVPDNLKFSRDIFIPIEKSKGAVNGHKVLVKLVSYGDQNRNPEGEVVKIIGHINDPGVDILSVVYAHDLPQEFPERVLNQAERMNVPVSEADTFGRTDLRDLLMVTIDGEDAKDLDDAVSLTKDENGWHLGVHIADVANYVQENSALDREALKRGTSVYLADRVIPMLPHALSNGICSLNEGLDRLALSCLMDIDEKGQVTGHQIVESVIRTNHRMSYTQVKKILADEDQDLAETYADVVPMLKEMNVLAKLLREHRRKRGSIDFDFPEAKIHLDENGHPTEILPYDRNDATKLIEDFMLIANETVAEDFYWQEIPFLYRVHETPDPEKIQSLQHFIQNFGYYIKGDREEIHPKELQKLLAKIADSPEEDLISRLTLRSMKRAKYSHDCTGHFGLASRYYCHFTSPIRRYPDLQIHRIIKETLRGRMGEERRNHYEEILPTVAEKTSEAERRADESERETLKLKKAEYMEDHIGEEFDGVISGITNWGIYVELPNTVEGLIHVSRLYDDRYYYKEDTMEMYGVDTGRIFKLGQPLRVRVADASKEERTVDFELAYEE